MKRSISVWQFAGFLFTSLLGTLLHFAFDWSNQSTFFALFSAVNESIWEHMKLLFFPMFIFALFESRYFSKEYKSFWCVKLKGILLGIILIPVLYYTYTGIFGISFDWANIAIFFIAATVSYIFETRLLKAGGECCISSKSSLAILFALALVFMILTFIQPRIPLFQDHVTKLYGIV